MSRWVSLGLLVGALACNVEEPDGAPETGDTEERVGEAEDALKGSKKPTCAIKCAAPPEGCHYENAVLSGPCHKLTCGDLVCDGNPT